MQLTTQDNYQTMVGILAEMITRFLPRLQRQMKFAKVNEQTFQLVSSILEQEDEEQVDFEMIVELLGTQHFKQIA